MRNSLFYFAWIAVCFSFPGDCFGQDAKPLIAQSSNLSGAMSGAEWTQVESSIDNGLAWLASQQAEDGSFPTHENANPAVTSFAVMAFLARGHLPDQGPYGKSITRAIDYVLSTQRRLGYFSAHSVAPGGGHLSTGQMMTYNHAIAGLMLGEVYGMTTTQRSKRIEVAIEKALLFHWKMQTREKKAPSDIGGWRYAYPEAPDASSDMSVTGWALMFLRSARTAEFNVPRQHFDDGLDFVQRCYETDASQHEKGVFRYRPSESDPQGNPQITLANTSSAMLTLILGGREDHDSIPVGVQWMRSRPYPKAWQNNYFYLASYYSSQAMAQVGGDTWNHVFPQIARNLLSEQTEQGAWPLGSGNERHFGNTYTTSLAILALTPAYQLLPIYQR